MTAGSSESGAGDRAQKASVAGVRSIGVALIVLGILLNERAIELLVAPDGDIEMVGTLWYVLVQIGLVAVGFWLATRGSRLQWNRAVRIPGAMAVFAGVFIGIYGNLRAFGVVGDGPAVVDEVLAERWQAMLESEEVLLELTPDFARVAKSLMNLQLPDRKSYDFFEDQVTVRDLAAAEPADRELRSLSVAVRHWEPAPNVRTDAPDNLRLWGSVLQEVAYFEHAKFYPIRMRALDDARDAYEIDVGFYGLARLTSGDFLALHGEQHVRVRRAAEAPEDAPRWKVFDWQSASLEGHHGRRLLFREVLDRAVPDRSALEAARRNRQSEFAAQLILDRDNFHRPHEAFEIASTDRHPGLSVVDLDRDGFDDLYVMPQWGKNMLFRNRGDGTFEEIAAEVGLDIEDHTSSAIFADFDNDGDADVFLGRTLERSMYLENDGGRFIDRSATSVDGLLPYFASSVSAVDYDQDGLLDLYVSTYAATMTDASWTLDAGFWNRRVLGDYLEADDARGLYRRLRGDDWRRTMNHYGPPNVLLRNTGRGFAIVRDAEATRIFRNTYQTTWADFDNDGDADLYAANDFGPNNLVRNDGGGVFVDITNNVTADVGFGMGAGWGDYDNDGREDLYVSNMFSKAGRRIMEQVPGLDPRFTQGARGNSLIANFTDGFELVSGSTPATKMVEIAGWSWSGQFADFDNDGFLDIYALSGHYTAPVDIAGAVDI